MGGHRAAVGPGRHPRGVRASGGRGRERHARKKKSEERGNDGWIPALIDWTAKRYGWGFEEIVWQVPLSALCLLRRQEAKNDKGEFMVFPLSEVEKIDDGAETES